MKMDRYIHIISRSVLACVLTFVLAACSTTKRLGDNEILYTGVKKMTIESVTDEKIPGSVESAVKEPLSIKPNNPLFSPYVRTPLPTGLWAWNAFYTEKDKGFRAWLFRLMAKKPVLISDVNPELRMHLVEDILDNHGYFGSSANYEILQKRNPKKARINYNIKVAEPWTYSNVEFPAIQGPVTRAIDTMKYTSPIQAGEQFDIAALTKERIRITNKLREESYYYFRPEYLEYLADTTEQRLGVDLRMVLAKGISPAALEPHNIGEITVSLLNNANDRGRRNQGKRGQQEQWRGRGDTTIVYNNIQIRYREPAKIRSKILYRALTIEPGQPARVSDINNTLTNLTRLGIFRYVNMEITPLDSLRPDDKIDMNITAQFDQPLESELEVNFSHKSSSFIGPGIMFSVKNKNALRGGEVLALRLNGAYEWQTGNRNSGSAVSMNSYEFGVNTSLTFPRLVGPKFIPRNKYNANTTYNLGVNFLNRAQYFTMASFNMGSSYDFQTSPGSFHNLTILKFTYNNLLRTTDKFDEVMDGKPALKRSFENQFIPSASYTYTWNKPLGRRKKDNMVWSTTATAAGNIFYGMWSAFGWDKPGEVFGNVFSQFVKLTSEVKYFMKTGRNSTLAMRFYAGAAKPYGNLDVLPYTEQFYIGGANSIRAFTIRSIGPGRYTPDEDDENGYFDQMGDMKLEANLEYRFGIFGGLKGAIFLDAGNIWLLHDDPTREGGKIQGRDFFKSIAAGTGAGLRYDLSFLVIRTDLGIGLHLPYDTGKSGYYNIPTFKDGLGFHIAIGYPF